MIGREQQERAGDYVLGLLEPEERAALEAEISADPELSAYVDGLQLRFAALDATARAEPVPQDLWSRVEARIGAPAPATRQAGRSSTPAWLAIAASIVLAVGIGFAAGRLSVPVEPAPVVVAVLMTDSASPGAIIEAFADNRVRLIPLEDFAVPEGKVLEVWTKWDEETGPVSLGQLDAAMEVTLAGPEQPIPQSGQLYEITLEDAPRSPTGRPTGPILGVGFAAIPPA